MRFTLDSGVMNSVSSNANERCVEIPVKSLDAILCQKSPRFLKIDVEGYEYFVLEGAKNVLSDSNLKFIIIEFNFSASKYGHENHQIFEILSNHNFEPIDYDGLTKEIKTLKSFNTHKFNTIFIRNAIWFKSCQRKATMVSKKKLF